MSKEYEIIEATGEMYKCNDITAAIREELKTKKGKKKQKPKETE